MFTLSIQKKEKVQVRYFSWEFLEPKYGTITKSRNLGCTTQQDNTRKAIQSILHPYGDTNDRLQVLNQYFSWNVYLSGFFTDHPNALPDLIHILSKSKDVIDNPEKWLSEKTREWIYKIFLQRWRQENTWRFLMNEIESHIINNRAFIQYCEKQPSILDSSYFTLDLLERNGWDIIILLEDLIKRWLSSNINKSVTPQIFQSTLQKIIKYLPLVFWSHDQIGLDYSALDSNITSVRALATSLYDKIKHASPAQKGYIQRDVWTLVQAFHAWGNIEEIEKYQKEAQDFVDSDDFLSHIQNKILKTNFKTTSIKETISRNPNVYRIKASYRWTSMDFIWRAKSIQSILHKMWEDREYTNESAMRDMIWISFVTPDDISEPILQKLYKDTTKLMPDYWYISKSKWNLCNTGWLEQHYESGKHPIYVTSSWSDTTNPMLDNISVWGFMKVYTTWSAIWTEVQIIKASNYEWKKKDDPLYKVLSKCNLLMRANKFITPEYLFVHLNSLFTSNHLRSISQSNEALNSIKSIDDLILYLIQTKNILVYYNNTGEILFTRKK